MGLELFAFFTWPLMDKPNHKKEDKNYDECSGYVNDGCESVDLQ